MAVETDRIMDRLTLQTLECGVMGFEKILRHVEERDIAEWLRYSKRRLLWHYLLSVMELDE